MVTLSTTMRTAVLLLLSGAATADPAAAPSAGQDLASRCLRLVDQHVRATRGWDKHLYQVRPEFSGDDNRGFAVLYTEELKTMMYQGERRSFHVALDPACRRVVRELAYQ